MAFLYPRHFCDLPILWDDPEWIVLHSQEVLSPPGRDDAAFADPLFNAARSASAQELPVESSASAPTDQTGPVVVSFDIWTNDFPIDDCLLPASDGTEDGAFMQALLIGNMLD
uniref:Uncharacterized protein n=1 Tax=Ditylenchus dipsaci TaxID=166011 RepID=A0A915DRZ2_9BILA